MASTTSKLSMTLLIDTKTEKVIFAVASKRVVDFLFNMLCLPVEFHKEGYGNEDGETGDDYYNEKEGDDNEDGENGDDYYNEDGENGDDYYNEDGGDGVYYDREEGYDYDDGENSDDYDYEEHANYNEDGSDDCVYFDEEEDEDGEDDDCHGEKDEDSEEEEKEFQGEARLYRCPKKCSKIVTSIKKPNCYWCKKPMEHITDYSELKPKDTGEDNVTFLVTDDLVFQPVTSMNEIVNKYNIKDYREMIVELRINEGIKLRKASLKSKMILTSVFVNKEY
ncbi:unnamed protein product [Lathyrus sativus]|nr:unnamed protein product [Lathyrus sativus]